MSDPKTGKDDDHDEILGLDLDSKPIFRPKGSPFTLIEMPPGSGKTVNLVIGSVLHRALLKYTLPPASTKGRRK